MGGNRIGVEELIHINNRGKMRKKHLMRRLVNYIKNKKLLVVSDL